ncbi:efflux RND transporter permease subunit [Rhizosphaericola mali]|uniref:Efflux RND transporter permease subunit n=1 Tax=Rhizosphaericola mali TaxID=2545455 RepID=A0A5P2G347_9BACT|nr:efflux RND transporter permease subunit [Rhizosphaericola mali]QES88230.1 efflux RND transporter permease subunit [Rhizosphaericola mali]
MGLIRTALRKPITILVLVAALVFFGINAVQKIKIDIFPAIDLPVIYISHPYGGFSPEQMEAYFAKNYVNMMLYVSGVKSIESKNIQGLTLIKLTFYPGTNMAQAAAEVSAFSNRAQASFPPGSQPPFILRFDASTLPVGQLVLSSQTKTVNQLQDLANVYIRPNFNTIPGLVSPAPFGGNARTILIKANPDLMRQHNISPDQLVSALTSNNLALPSGNVQIGNYNYQTPLNTNINSVQEFGNIPLFKDNGVQNLYVKDVATVSDGADITQGYVLVNGKRSVYLPVTKSSTASTWSVVQGLRKAIPIFAAQLPSDVKVSYEFDQSKQVMNSVKSLMSEGAIGAVLTGLMVLLFLGDPRGALIVILTIPTCIISSVLFLYLFGQTINIMTLSGLALAIGILVDESTVTIENIHQHMDMGKSKALAIWDGCKEIAFAKLLVLFCILAVFAPAFTMGGIPGSLFLPLSLAIAFAMITSYFMAQTLVPVLANWLMKEHKHPHGEDASAKATSDTWDQKSDMALREDTNSDKKLSGFEKFHARFVKFMDRLLKVRKPVVIIYLIVAFGGIILLVANIGQDILPYSNAGIFQVRLREPDGTKAEVTESAVLKTLNALYDQVGKKNIEISSAMVGMHGGTFSTNPVYLFMAGTQEAVLQVEFKEGYKVNMDDFKDAFRARMKKLAPEMKMSFEPIELTSKILAQGSPTPIEVQIKGKNKAQNAEYANKVVNKLKQIPYLRDVQIDEAIHYPSIKINIDRVRAAQLGTDIQTVSKSIIAATSSSRYTAKNIWLDPKINNSYYAQVEIPINQMTSLDNIKEIPVVPNQSRPILEDLATVVMDTTVGEVDDIGALPILNVTANLNHMDLGTATRDVTKAVDNIGQLPRGLTMSVLGESPVLTDTLSSLQAGLLVAIIVIFLMLTANFQSMKVSLVVLCTVPAVLAGSLLFLKVTGCTLNLQSYMGMIMSVGVSISNAVLLVTNAEHLWKSGKSAKEAAKEAASLRLRPIIMTSVAMIVGMVPMASGLSESGDQTAPLGRAVIGGLFSSTFAALLILPLVFAWALNKTSRQSVSLDPEDEESVHFEAELYGKNAQHPDNLATH